MKKKLFGLFLILTFSTVAGMGEVVQMFRAPMELFGVLGCIPMWGLCF